MIAIVAALLSRRPTVAALTAATVWTADAIALATKLAFDRPRPFVVEPTPRPLLLGVLGDSFPSAHAATSFAGAIVLMRWVPRSRRWVLALLAVAIAFSRVYVGVHYPGDVIAGGALGALVAIALPRLVAIRPQSRRARRAG